jgi:peptidoglycan-associated lipoprotein
MGRRVRRSSMKKWFLAVLVACLSFSLFFTTGCKKHAPQAQKTAEVEPVPAAEEPSEMGQLQEVTKEEQPPSGAEQPVSSEALGRGYILDPVHFDFDKYDIRPADRAVLAAHAEWLKQHPAVKVMIEGHCDERGTVEYNLALGDKRATAVRRYLIDLGINPDRLSWVSYGKERPVDPGHNEEAWFKNRRAEFRRAE